MLSNSQRNTGFAVIDGLRRLHIVTVASLLTVAAWTLQEGEQVTLETMLAVLAICFASSSIYLAAVLLEKRNDQSVQDRPIALAWLAFMLTGGALSLVVIFIFTMQHPSMNELIP